MVSESVKEDILLVKIIPEEEVVPEKVENGQSETAPKSSNTDVPAESPLT